MISKQHKKPILLQWLPTAWLKKFVKPLFEFNTENDYPARIGCLVEIVDWSEEFCDQHYDKISGKHL